MSDANDEDPRLDLEIVNPDTAKLRRPRWRNCDHELCRQEAEEWHHSAPQQFFDDAEMWPKFWLCRPHHVEWHQRMNAGYRLWFGVDYAEDITCPSCGMVFASPGDPEHLNDR